MWGWYTGGTSNSFSTLALFLTLWEQGVIVLVRMSKYLFNFPQKVKLNEEEVQAGSGVVFTNRFHCISEKLLFSLLKQYSTRNTCGQGHNWPHNSAQFTQFICLFIFAQFTKTAEVYKLQLSKAAFKNLFTTVSLAFITWLIPKWAAGFGMNWWVMKWNDAENVAGYLSHVYPSVTIDCV